MKEKIIEIIFSIPGIEPGYVIESGHLIEAGIDYDDVAKAADKILNLLNDETSK